MKPTNDRRHLVAGVRVTNETTCLNRQRKCVKSMSHESKEIVKKIAEKPHLFAPTNVNDGNVFIGN